MLPADAPAAAGVLPQRLIKLLLLIALLAATPPVLNGTERANYFNRSVEHSIDNDVSTKLTSSASISTCFANGTTITPRRLEKYLKNHQWTTA